MAKITKAKISKVGHVVLGCRDPQASIPCYTEALGMARVPGNPALQMACFSCGERDHDIAVVTVPEDHPVGSAGLTHTALQLEGEAELRDRSHRLKAHGVPVDVTADHAVSTSVSGVDPDGTRLAEAFAPFWATRVEPSPCRREVSSW